MNLKKLHKFTWAFMGLLSALSSRGAAAQEHWYGDVRHVMVTPVISEGELSPQGSDRIENTVARALRENLIGVTVSPRSEMQTLWAEMATRENGVPMAPAPRPMIPPANGTMMRPEPQANRPQPASAQPARSAPPGRPNERPGEHRHQ